MSPQGAAETNIPAELKGKERGRQAAVFLFSETKEEVVKPSVNQLNK